MHWIKHFFTSAVWLLLFSISGSGRAQQPSNAIVFEEKIHDFGTVLEENGKVSHKFYFQNKGKTPVTIDDIYSDCGCIGKITSKGEVKPGAKGEVVITFNPGYKSGYFSKEIVVYSNKRSNYNRIWVQGRVTPAEHPVEEDYPYNFGSNLYLRLKVMAFGYLKPGETKEMELHYANNSNKEMNLTFNHQGSSQGLKFPNPGRIAAKGRGVIKVSFTMPKQTQDDILITVTPEVNGKKLTETLQVKVLNISKPGSANNRN